MGGWSDWDQALAELRHEYLREAPERVAELWRALEDVRCDPRDAGRLEELRRGFHGFAGSGGTYGFPKVSELGREAERLCRAAEERAPGPDDLTAWTRTIEGISNELQAAGESSSSPLAAPRPAGPDEEPVDALVVDDDAAITRALAARLAQDGFHVRTAGSVGEARVAIAERLPDVLVADVVLPDGTGFQIVEETRLAPGGDQPVIFVVSVRTDFVDRVEAIHCGADAYLDKPVDWDALSRRLRHSVEARRLATVRVLSVEDDPQQAAFLRTVLSSGGYEVKTCADPRGFESDLAAFQPDLVLMDVMLPGASGYDLVRYLRQEERYTTLPVVVLTAESRVEARMSATRAGADDFLIKPVTPGLLLSSVAARVERARFVRGLLERDGLTQLLTHTAFLERAHAAAARAERDPARPIAWAMIDVDRFKDVNDRYGHPVGDRVLVSLARHLRRRLRQSDTLGRYGGEEFAVLVESLDRDGARRLFDRVRAEFAEVRHRDPSGGTSTVTFSVGVALLRPGMESVDAWRQRADDALYAAKRAGRNQVVVANDASD
jgi:diguanylate cyclase (GGDEF)-like protein